MQAFEFYCPAEIYFGKGAEVRVGEAVKHFVVTKVFIVCSVLSGEPLRELAEHCTFFHARTAGRFRPLDRGGILAVCRTANK